MNFNVILVRLALLAGREKGGTMRKLVSCEFNIDTACVELRYADGEVLSIYTPGIEDSFDTTGSSVNIGAVSA